jgi:Rieske 2Fe-2S family protein
VNPWESIVTRLRQHQPTSPLARDFYISPADYRVELESIWYRDWLFVGHDCEIPLAGDYFTVQVGDYPLLVLRDREGVIRAFPAGIAARAFARRRMAGLPGSSVPITSGVTGSMAP